MKIEKNVKMPTKPKYPFKDMKVSDSFVIEDGEAGRHRVASAGTNYCSKNKLKSKFSTGKDESGDLRCWRVK